MSGRTTDRIRPTFGARLAAARHRLGLSQQTLADRMGVNRTLVMYYERRARSPRLEMVHDLSAALKIAPEVLLGIERRTLRKKPGPRTKLDELVEKIRMFGPSQRDMVVRTFLAALKEMTARRKGNGASERISS